MKFDLLFLIILSFLFVLKANASRVKKLEENLNASSMSLMSLIDENKNIFRHAKESKSRFENGFSFKSVKNGANNNFGNKSAGMIAAEELLKQCDLTAPCNVQENNCPTIMSGWLKFLEITEASPIVPNTFIKNKEFYLQQSQNQSMNTNVKDNLGYINIPSEDYFYFELNKLQLKVFTARTPKYRKIDRFLNIKDLIRETNLNPCKGGVEDVGNFAEGYCFMLKYTRFTRFFVWELCADSPFEKDKWMTTLAKLNSMKQDIAIVQPLIPPVATVQNFPQVTAIPTIPAIPAITPIPAVTPFPHAAVGIAPPIAQIGVGVVPHGPITSNTLVTSAGNSVTISTHHGPGWVPASGWGPCSEPCGPGVQIRKLRCILDDGCNGADQEEKMCKLKDCKRDLEEHLNKLKQVAECGQWKLLGEWTPCTKPCGGGVQFRKRECVPANLPCVGKAEISQPCNMHSCRIEDEPDCKQIEMQLNMILEMGAKPVPVHLIININEITIQREPLLAPLATIPLTDIRNLHCRKSVPGCFNVSNQNNNNYCLCPELREETECEKWMRKIQNFKENCNNKILEKITTDIEKGPACLDPNKKLALMNQKALEAEREKTQSKLLSLDNKFTDFKRQIGEILDKEDAYERGLEEQEKIKECKEKKATEAMLKKQEDAARMLLDDMTHLHQQDNEYLLREKAIRREMKMMMDDVKKKIADKRSKLVTKIQRMKILHDLDQKKAAHKLLEMKREFGKKIGDLAKKGNPQVCFNATDQKSIDCYCDKNFPSGDMNFDCKTPKKFCYMCCDHEIGSLDHYNLDCCYNRCDSQSTFKVGCNGFFEVYHVTTSTVVPIAAPEVPVSKCASGHCEAGASLATATNSLFN